MRYLRFPVMASTLALAACATPSPQIDAQRSFPMVDVQWAGRFAVDYTSTIADGDIGLSGTRAQSRGGRPIEETSKIPAVLGTHFGYSYVIRGTSKRDVKVRYIWRFPPGGLRNASTGVVAMYVEKELSCRIGDVCSAAWFLNHDWELRPGKWTGEIWLGAHLLASHDFELVLP